MVVGFFVACATQTACSMYCSLSKNAWEWPSYSRLEHGVAFLQEC